MPTVTEIADFLQEFAPLRLAESWDNVGLLVGDPARQIERIMTCLTITRQTALEAIDDGAELIVAHHPLPFRPVKRITTATTDGEILWRLIGNQVAVYSPHTAFDSAAGGMNQRLAELLGLANIQPLIAPPGEAEQTATTPVGTGRQGILSEPRTLDALSALVKERLGIPGLHRVGRATDKVSRVGIVCGSAGELLPAAIAAGCEVVLSGEMRFHSCLEAEAAGVGLLLVGHYASERFGVEALAQILGQQFPAATLWASRRERDPLSWV